MKKFWTFAAWFIWSVGGLLSLVVLFLYIDWFGQHIYPWIQATFEWAVLIDLLILCPMLIFRRTRRGAARGLFHSSSVFGIKCWTLSFLATYVMFGEFWTVFGTLLGGLGVIPLAFFGYLLHHTWTQALEIPGLIILTLGTRFGAAVLLAKQTK
jgi:hypothetical protein